MTALAMYGVEMVHEGTTWMAAKCLKQLLELDPADNIGVVDLFAEAGVDQPGFGEETNRRVQLRTVEL